MGERAGAETNPVEPGRALFQLIAANRRSTRTALPFRVAALNLWGLGRVEEIAACLQAPQLHPLDVIMLCEAGWRTRRAAGREVVAELAAKLNMSFAFAPSFGFPRGSGPITAFSGNAILCSEPLYDVTMVPMSASPALLSLKHRIGKPAALFASTVIGGRKIALGVAHLDRNGPPRLREGQVVECLERFPSHGPAVIAGDFNTTTIDWTGPQALLKVAGLMMLQPRRFRDPVRYEPLFQRLRAAGFEIDGANPPFKPTFAFTRFIPPFLRPKLDWIALRGLKAVPGSAAVLAPRASAWKPRASDHDVIACQVTV